MAKFKICPVCGRQFKTCTTCESSSAPSWKKYCDSFEHYDIYATVILYTRHELSKEEAAERLAGYPKKGFNPQVQKYLDEIFAGEVETVLTDEVAISNEVDTTSDEEVVETPKKRRRNKGIVFGQD